MLVILIAEVAPLHPLSAHDGEDGEDWVLDSSGKLAVDHNARLEEGGEGTSASHTSSAMDKELLFHLLRGVLGDVGDCDVEHLVECLLTPVFGELEVWPSREVVVSELLLVTCLAVFDQQSPLGEVSLLLERLKSDLVLLELEHFALLLQWKVLTAVVSDLVGHSHHHANVIPLNHGPEAVNIPSAGSLTCDNQGVFQVLLEWTLDQVVIVWIIVIATAPPLHGELPELVYPCVDLALR